MEGFSKVRPSPRISAPKLGEYLEATAHRREGILRDQKFPPQFKQIRYENSRKAIQEALITGGNVPERLSQLAIRIEQLVPRSSFGKDAIRLCARATRQFARLYAKLPIKGCVAVRPDRHSFIVEVEGVSISVAPIALLERAGRHAVMEYGAILAVFKKSATLGERSGRAVAEMVRQAVSRKWGDNVKPELCIVVDVFSGEVYAASGRHQRIKGEIASACREIAARWPGLRATRAA